MNRAGARNNDRTILWLACIAALCAGFYLACIRLEMLITATQSDDRQTIAIVAANQRVLSERRQLESTAAELGKNLGALELHADHPTVVAHFLTNCARVAAVHHTAVVQIDEHRPAAGVAPDPLTAGDDAAFEQIPLDVTLSGSYRNILLALRDLVDAPVATSIAVAAIERADAADTTASSAELTARLHVTLTRLRSAARTYPAVGLAIGDPSCSIHLVALHCARSARFVCSVSSRCRRCAHGVRALCNAR